MVIIAAKKAPRKTKRAPAKPALKFLPPSNVDPTLDPYIAERLSYVIDDFKRSLRYCEEDIKYLESSKSPDSDSDKVQAEIRSSWKAHGYIIADQVLRPIRDTVVERMLEAVTRLDDSKDEPGSNTQALQKLLAGLKADTIQEKALNSKAMQAALKMLEKAASTLPRDIGTHSGMSKLRDTLDSLMDAWKALTGKAPKVPDFKDALPRPNPDQLTMFTSARVARVAARFAAQEAIKNH